MKVNGESIYGAAACPFATAPAWGRVTRKPGKLYLHVFDWPANGKLTLPALDGRKPASAYPLADPQRPPLPMATTIAAVELTLPLRTPDRLPSVIAVEFAK